MRDLEREIALKFPFAILSGTSLPGEGEHKLIHELRKLSDTERQTICIYGLDADLILICLQHHKLSVLQSFHLLRESSEFNDPKVKHAEFATMNIHKLLQQVPIEINQYIALSILCFGNDFMPNLAMFSLREDGYDRALHMYQECRRPNLLTSDGRKIFLQYAASKELDVLKERVSLRKRPEEKALLGKNSSLFIKKYGLHVLDGVTNMVPVVEAYWKTFHWTLWYFQKGVPLNWDWVYPYSDAPLVTDISGEKETISLKGPLTFTVTNQLQFIMPKKSLRKTRRLLKYPDEQYVETRNPWMKKFDWEMKPRISLPWNPTCSLTEVVPL
jgi:5'-3' exonuclease